MTGWFHRLVQHTFHGKQLMTEETLLLIARDIAQTRAALGEVFQEVSLALQAIDLLDKRVQQALPAVPGEPLPLQPSGLVMVAPPEPTTLTRDQRQRSTA